jgi:hypothetical protein
MQKSDQFQSQEKNNCTKFYNDKCLVRWFKKPSIIKIIKKKLYWQNIWHWWWNIRWFIWRKR